MYICLDFHQGPTFITYLSLNLVSFFVCLHGKPRLLTPPDTAECTYQGIFKSLMAEWLEQASQ